MTTRKCLTFKERMKIVEYLKQSKTSIEEIVNELIDLQNILDVPVSEDLLSLKKTLSDSNGS